MKQHVFHLPFTQQGRERRAWRTPGRKQRIVAAISAHITSPIRRKALDREARRIRSELIAEFDGEDTFPLQPVVRGIDRNLYPALYRAAPDLSPPSVIETTIERYRREHGGMAPSLMYLDEEMLLAYLRVVAPELFVFRSANGKHTVCLRPAPELAARMAMCYQGYGAEMLTEQDPKGMAARAK